MGFFDLLNPVFDAADRNLAIALSGGWRLTIWALLGAAATMWLYRATSKQDRIAEIRADVRRSQRELSAFDGELNELMPLIRSMFGLSLRQLGMSLGPALIASIPLIFLLAWISNRYSADLPPPGAEIAIAVQSAASSLPDQWQQDPARIIAWPATGSQRPLTDADGQVLLTLPLDAPSAVVHKRQWWNGLIGNPAGYLPPASTVEAIHFDFPQHEYVDFGPAWMRGGIALFLVGLMFFSLAIKLIFRIN